MNYSLPGRWYRERDGERFGPYTIPELYRLLETGEAGPEERLEAESGTEWLTISEVLRRSREGLSGHVPLGQPLTTATQSQQPTGQTSSVNYLVRHWRGDLSLALSYWVNLVLLAAAIRIFFAAAGETNLFATMSYYATAVLITALVSASALVVVWQIVGTWRSSDRHTSRGGRKVWAVTAKIMLILGVLRGGLEYATSEIPTVMNAWRHAAAMSGMPPSEFGTLRGGTEIEFSGGLHAGAAKRLEALLGQNPMARVIHLGSDGGDTAEGHAMAAIIRSRGLDTYVRTRCLSACTTVFLAGRNRLLREGAQLGFHAPTTVAAGLPGTQAVAEERRRLAGAGMPDWFVSRAFAVQGDAIWFPTIDELRTARAITGTTNGRHLSPGRPNPPMTMDQAERALRALPLGAALERVEPAVFRETVVASRDAMNDGGTDDDLASAIERRVSPIYARSLTVLPDRQLVATLRTTIETARRVGASDPRTCRDWLMHRSGQPIPLIGQHVTREQQAALLQTMADAIITAADPRQRATPPRQAPPQLDQVIRRLEARLPRGQMLLLETIDSPSHPPSVVCSLVIELYTEILRLPEREAGPLLRFMLASA